MSVKTKNVLGSCPEAETGRKDGVSCVPPKVMLGAGRKDGMSFSRELDSRYDYLGASRTRMCDA